MIFDIQSLELQYHFSQGEFDTQTQETKKFFNVINLFFTKKINLNFL